MSDLTINCGFGCSSVEGCQGHCENPAIDEDRGGCDCSAAMNGASDHHSSCSMAPREWSDEKFIDDWNAMVAAVAQFSDRYNLPKPEMVYHPRVHALMDIIGHTTLLKTIIYRDVKIRFGYFEQADVLRQP